MSASDVNDNFYTKWERVGCRAGRGVAFAFAPFSSYLEIGSARTPGQGRVVCARSSSEAKTLDGDGPHKLVSEGEGRPSPWMGRDGVNVDMRPGLAGGTCTNVA
jgi:hypothetical protein